MPVIHTLPDDVARRIAAGEVVERPASVVKELLENAVDAGAKSITITVAGGGDALIDVRDDGTGMGREDVELAPLNFSTSKIHDADDLHRISSYGFRGEALASISSVSRFEIVSSDVANGEGWRVRVEGKSIVESAPAPHARGTTVRVRDLFFNTPARKRFLKSSITERRRILETILSFALVLPEVEIHYIDDGRHVLDFLPASSWRERVAAVLGASAMGHMVDVELQSGSLHVQGFVSLPTHTRGNRFSQFFYVNQRAVRERTLVHALQDAYRNVIPYKRYPVAVLSLSMPPEEVDVNVHPSKLEVRVQNERAVFASVRQAIKTALTAKSESVLSVARAARSGTGPPLPRAGTPAWATAPVPATPDAGARAPAFAGGLQGASSAGEHIRDAFADYVARRDALAPAGNAAKEMELALETVVEPVPAEAAVQPYLHLHPGARGRGRHRPARRARTHPLRPRHAAARRIVAAVAADSVQHSDRAFAARARGVQVVARGVQPPRLHVGAVRRYEHSRSGLPAGCEELVRGTPVAADLRRHPHRPRTRRHPDRKAGRELRVP
jgi:DNA mismatch repair protein MutL